jgi:hypothetical protein
MLAIERSSDLHFSLHIYAQSVELPSLPSLALNIIPVHSTLQSIMLASVVVCLLTVLGSASGLAAPKPHPLDAYAVSAEVRDYLLASRGDKETSEPALAKRYSCISACTLGYGEVCENQSCSGGYDAQWYVISIHVVCTCAL